MDTPQQLQLFRNEQIPKFIYDKREKYKLFVILQYVNKKIGKKAAMLGTDYLDQFFQTMNKHRKA